MINPFGGNKRKRQKYTVFGDLELKYTANNNQEVEKKKSEVDLDNDGDDDKLMKDNIQVHSELVGDISYCVTGTDEVIRNLNQYENDSESYMKSECSTSTPISRTHSSYSRTPSTGDSPPSAKQYHRMRLEIRRVRSARDDATMALSTMVSKVKLLI